MGVTSPRYRLFVLASVCLHVAALYLVPVDWVDEFIGRDVEHAQDLARLASASRSHRTIDAVQLIEFEVLREPPPVESRDVPRIVTVETPPEPPPPEFEVSEEIALEPESESVEQLPATPSAPPGVVASPAAAPAAGSPEATLVPPVHIAVRVPKAPPEVRLRRDTPVKLMLHVTAAGGVSEVRVAEPSGCIPCEEAAMEAAWRMRFRPARRGTTAVDAWWTYTWIFGR